MMKVEWAHKLGITLLQVPCWWDSLPERYIHQSSPSFYLSLPPPLPSNTIKHCVCGSVSATGFIVLAENSITPVFLESSHVFYGRY